MEIKEYIQWLLPSRKWRVLVITITGVVVSRGTLILCMLRVHTYLAGGPAVCVNCHIMGPYYATWFHSSHSRNATCNDCHVSHENAVKKQVFEGMDNMHHVAVFLTHGKEDVVRANGEDSEVIMNDCTRYRTQLNTELVSTGRTDYMMSQTGGGKTCWNCHRNAPHGGSNNVTPIPNALVSYPDSPTPEQLKKMIE